MNNKEPTEKAVAAATAACILSRGSEHLWGIRMQVAKDLGLAGAMPDLFCRQVFRKLRQMTDSGELVMISDGREPVYYTPGAHAEMRSLQAASRFRLL